MNDHPCAPVHNWRPNTTERTEGQQTAEVFFETRSRLKTAGTMFRSKLFGKSENSIEVEIIDTGTGFMLHIYKDNNLQESYGPVDYDEKDISGICIPTAASIFRGLVSISSLIEMPSLDFGGTVDNTPWFDAAVDEECMYESERMSLDGGNPPNTEGFVDQLHTGPERTMIFIHGTEDSNGHVDEQYPNTRVREWDGTNWIVYTPKEECEWVFSVGLPIGSPI